MGTWGGYANLLRARSVCVACKRGFSLSSLDGCLIHCPVKKAITGIDMTSETDDEIERVGRRLLRN